MKRVILSLFLLLLVPSAIATAKEVCSFSPTAKITTTPVSGSSPDFVFRDGTEVVFSGATSTANNCNGSITEYRWKIEGVYYYGSTKTYTFPALGASEHRKTYSVELRVRNDASPNLYNTKTITVTVKRPQRIYHLKDHLGNVRTSVDTEGNVVGYDDYYPFGLTMPGRSSNSANPNDTYKFTGHERDDEAGLNIDYMGARMYDPSIARMMQVDPAHARAPGWTPYRYAFNNPMRYLDPDGRYEVDGHYWTVYLAAMVSGRNDARTLAYFAELPDYAMTNTGDIGYATNTWMQYSKRASWHALSGGRSISERANSRSMFSNASNAYGRGIALHRLGDSYAHSKSNGSMYGPGVGHLFAGHSPDKIANRPELYLQYVNDLVGTLGGSNADLFTFNYVANSGGSTQQNSAIFEAEVRLREGVGTFSVGGSHGSVIGNYINARNKHYGSNYTTTTAEVDRYTRNKDGEWVKTTETRIYITSQ